MPLSAAGAWAAAVLGWGEPRGRERGRLRPYLTGLPEPLTSFELETGSPLPPRAPADTAGDGGECRRRRPALHVRLPCPGPGAAPRFAAGEGRFAPSSPPAGWGSPAWLGDGAGGPAAGCGAAGPGHGSLAAGGAEGRLRARRPLRSGGRWGDGRYLHEAASGAGGGGSGRSASRGSPGPSAAAGGRQRLRGGRRRRPVFSALTLRPPGPLREAEVGETAPRCRASKLAGCPFPPPAYTTVIAIKMVGFLYGLHSRV